MTSRRGISNDDAQLFRSVVGAVRELPDSNRVSDLGHSGARKPAPRPRPQSAESAINDHSMPDGVLEDAPGFGEQQQYRKSSVSQRVWRQLRRGQIRIDDELDLHGNRVDTARVALARFLSECTHRECRCVRVITGKGFGSQGSAPILKAQVDRWLRLRDEVLAFCSTTARDGGTGAVYVLLRHAPRHR